MSLVEISIVVFILGLVLVSLVRFMRGSVKESVQMTLGLESQDALRDAMRELERDFREMVQIDVARAGNIEFRLDSHRLPGYNPNGDPDGDGIPNVRDADVDNDYATLSAPANRWQFGYNVSDDDEFGPGMSDVAVSADGRIDVLCRYFVRNGDLVRDFNFNGQPDANANAGWRQNERILARKLAPNGFRIEYYGNVTEPLGLNVDTGNDGIPGTRDAGEGDHIVTGREIDWTTPANGGNGDQSGAIDTFVERQYIFFLAATLAQDLNGDGKDDFHLRTELSPLMLSVRRSLP